MEERKNLMEVTAESFKHLSSDNKMFVLGYMVGVQKSKEIPNPPEAVDFLDQRNSKTA